MGLRLSHQSEILLGGFEDFRKEKLVEGNQITGAMPLKEMLRPKTLSFSYFFMTTKGELLSPLWILYYNKHFITSPEKTEAASYGLKALKSWTKMPLPFFNSQLLCHIRKQTTFILLRLEPIQNLPPFICFLIFLLFAFSLTWLPCIVSYKILGYPPCFSSTF